MGWGLQSRGCKVKVRVAKRGLQSWRGGCRGGVAEKCYGWRRNGGKKNSRGGTAGEGGEEVLGAAEWVGGVGPKKMCLLFTL